MLLFRLPWSQSAQRSVGNLSAEEPAGLNYLRFTMRNLTWGPHCGSSPLPVEIRRQTESSDDHHLGEHGLLEAEGCRDRDE